MIAHVVGMPLEELAPAVSGVGAMLLATRAWLTLHLRRLREEPGT